MCLLKPVLFFTRLLVTVGLKIMGLGDSGQIQRAWELGCIFEDDAMFLSNFLSLDVKLIHYCFLRYLD